MSFWSALEGGVRGFQGGVNFSQQAVARNNALRDQADERTRQDTVSDLERQMAGSGQPPAAQGAEQTMGAPQAPTVPQPGTATTTVGQTNPVAPAEAAPDPTATALAASTARFSTTGATGTSQPNESTYRQITTGGNLPEGRQTIQGIRAVSGNADGPVSRNDLNAYLDRARNLFAQRGIGHMYEEWQARTMQSMQSSAQRSLAFAAVAMEAGNAPVAAQWLQRAYGYIPDGANGQVTVGPDGNLVASRTGADGRAIGEPTRINAQRLREMSISMANPATMETLLVQRATQAETGRHNQAIEGIQSERNRVLAANGRAGRAQPPQNPATLADVKAATEQVEPHLDAALQGRRGAGGRGIDRAGVSDMASDLYLYGFRNGVTPRTAAGTAAALAAGDVGTGDNQVRIRRHSSGAPVASFGGVTFPLSGSAAVLAEQYLNRQGMPGAAPSAPVPTTGVSPRGNRPAPAPPVVNRQGAAP